MRTTVNLDDDVLRAARAIARVERRGLGGVVSDLARRGLAPRESRIEDRAGFPVFRVPAGAAPITEEMVEAALEGD
ncbi:MAG: antitoxin [Candidatus Dormibacteria bacterium]